MIKINKPKFWDKKNLSFFAVLLYPLSLIVIFVVYLKKLFSKEIDFKIPIICVGNIYIGGTGKTPTSIILAKELAGKGMRPVILRKYYKNHIDEINQIKNTFNHLIINKNRINGINEAINKNYDTVILDDGLQDYKVKKNLNIVCFNQNQLIGNGLVIPSGPLRENLSILKKVHVVLINGVKDLDFENKILRINKNLDIYYCHYQPKNIEKFRNDKLLVLAGIANPENFLSLLKKNNLNIKEKLFFPDHYTFTKKEIKNVINHAKQKRLKVIMTEKDYFKLKDFDLDNYDYLKVNLEISNKEELFKKILDIYVKKN